MPTRAQVKRSVEIVEEARERLKGILVIDFVVPDYYATWPKPCMGGWGRGSMNVTPSGKVLPCHAAETVPGLAFDNVRDKPLAEIWLHGQAFEKFRGTDWMIEPCRSCERREIDWGGCRCQAFALAGNAAAADPACVKSPRHRELVALAESETAVPPPAFVYRRPQKAAPLEGSGVGKAPAESPT
jgi:pyrroloquinoline quinone biosynthesis protein E